MATLKRFQRCSAKSKPAKDPEVKGLENELVNCFVVADEKRKRCKTWPEINSTVNIEDSSDIVKKKGNGIEETIKRVRVDGMEAYSMSTTCLGKCFWSIIIVISSLIMTFELYKSVHDYWASPLVTTFSIIPVSEMDFPQIYICLTNNIKKTHFHNLGLSGKSHISVKKNLKDYFMNCTSQNSAMVDEKKDQYENDTYRFLMSVGYDVDQLFTSCTFNNFYPKPIRCSTIVRSLYDDEYGKCYLLSLVDFKQKIRGSGLLVGLNLSHSLLVDDPCVASESIGLKVTIAKSYSLSSPDSVFVGPGSYNNLDLTVQHLMFKNLRSGPHPQPCINQGDIDMQYMIGNYSQAACQKDCELQTMIKICHCIPLMDPYFLNGETLKSIKFCTSEAKQNCLYPKVLQSAFALDEIETCRQKCLIPCDMWRYPVNPSWQPLNPKKFPGVSDVQDVLYLRISFANMEIETFEQNPSKMFDEMVSDIGGQINLWLGASMVTLIQIPVVIALLISWACVGNVHKTTKSHKISLVQETRI